MATAFLRVFFGESWIGPGKVQLLETIQREGSISAAARKMKISYRRAWLLVNAVNKMFKAPAVDTKFGGRGGGTAVVTPFGSEIIRRYRSMEAATTRAIARDAVALQRRVR